MRVLVTGRHGQVSRELQLSLSQHELLVLGHEQLDLADVAAIRRQVRELRPDLIINAAAQQDRALTPLADACRDLLARLERAPPA